MSLKVVLPFSLVVFGGAATTTTGVYFHTRGAGKNNKNSNLGYGDPKGRNGPNGQGAQPPKTLVDTAPETSGPAVPPSNGDSEKKEEEQTDAVITTETPDSPQHPPVSEESKNSSADDVDNKHQPENQKDDSSAKVNSNGEHKQQQSTEEPGSDGLQQQPKDSVTSNTAENPEQSSGQSSEIATPGVGGSGDKEGEQKGAQDAVERPEEHTQAEGKRSDDQNTAPSGEGGEGHETKDSSSPTEPGTNEQASNTSDNGSQAPDSQSSPLSPEGSK